MYLALIFRISPSFRISHLDLITTKIFTFSSLWESKEPNSVNIILIWWFSLLMILRLSLLQNFIIQATIDYDTFLLHTSQWIWRGSWEIWDWIWNKNIHIWCLRTKIHHLVQFHHQGRDRFWDTFMQRSQPPVDEKEITTHW